MVVVRSDAGAVAHYELTIALLIDHDPHELTMVMMSLA